MTGLDEIIKTIQDKDNFLLLGHVDPDGDCIGSLFGLKWTLDQLGKQVKVLLADPPEDRYQYLGITPQDFEILTKESSLNYKDQCIITLDAGDQERLGDGIKFIDEGFFLINIDHHPGNPEYGHLNYVNPTKAAVGVIIYDLIEMMGLKIGCKIGNALATAVIADTGGLRYQNTKAHIYSMLARLVNLGIDNYQINKALFGSHSYESVKLKGYVLSTLSISSDAKIAWVEVTQSALQKTETEMNAISGLVNYPRDIKGVEVGIAFFELKNQRTKVGFRSNHYCPVNEIAAYFGGGGHARAAGCIIDYGLEETIKLVLSKVAEYV